MQNFWKDKKVLITGHTGFKGSWALLWLHSLGAKLYGYSLEAPTQPSMYESMQLKKLLIEEETADVCDDIKVSDFIKKVNPEVIFHMAAQPLVRYSYEHPIQTYATNVMGTAHVMEAARSAPSLRSLVVITTDKCYENFERAEGYSEDEPMGGFDPYSSSKGCAELVVSAMRRSFFNTTQVGVASARAGNVIGGGDWAPDRIIPDLIRNFHEGTSCLVRNPMATRPWQHVLEPIGGYLLLAEKLYHSPKDLSGAWNFGPYESDVQNVKFVADELAKHWGTGARWDYDKNQHPHEAKLLKLKIDKAVNKLNWRPKLTLEKALEMTTEWYRDFYAGRDMQAKSCEQIKFFQNIS